MRRGFMTGNVRIQALLLAMAVVCGAADAAAQALPVAPGDRIRVLIEGQRGEHTFTVLETDSAALLVSPRLRNGSNALPLASVKRLEVSRGRYSRGAAAARSAGKGALAGALVGGVLGYATGRDPCKPGAMFCYSPEEGAAVFAAVFGGAGIVSGAMGGALKGEERWERVWVPPVTAAVLPSGGMRLGFSRSF